VYYARDAQRSLFPLAATRSGACVFWSSGPEDRWSVAWGDGAKRRNPRSSRTNTVSRVGTGLFSLKAKTGRCDDAGRDEDSAEKTTPPPVSCFARSDLPHRGGGVGFVLFRGSLLIARGHHPHLPTCGGGRFERSDESGGGGLHHHLKRHCRSKTAVVRCHFTPPSREFTGHTAEGCGH
jgi:hypothetical protein